MRIHIHTDMMQAKVIFKVVLGISAPEALPRTYV